MTDWDLITGYDRDMHLLRNMTGAAAYDVNVQVSGAFVVGTFGKRDWSTHEDEIPAGKGIEFVGKQAFGNARIDITWHAVAEPDDGTKPETYTIDL